MNCYTSAYDEGFWSYILCRKVARKKKNQTHIVWKSRVVVWNVSPRTGL